MVLTSTEVHFPSMVMREKIYGDGSDTRRFYDVKRTGDATWEYRMTDFTFHRKLKYARDYPFVADAEKIEAAGNPWLPLNDASIESAYQRFIHAADVPVIYEHWRQEGADQTHEDLNEARRLETKKGLRKSRDDRLHANVRDGAVMTFSPFPAACCLRRVRPPSWYVGCRLSRSA
jgi:hypothetical protein